MAKVKAMLFTIGLLMLSLVVLILAIIIFNSFQKSELTMSDVGALDRAYDVDISIQNVLKNLFESSSGINVLVDANNNFVSFEENLPNSKYSIFNFTVMGFKNFTESNFDYISLNLTGIIKELPLIVMPHNIEYRHLNFGNRTIKITPSSINFDKYELFLALYENITSCPALYNETTSFDFYVQADGPEMDCSSRKLELDTENRVVTEKGFVYLKADSNGNVVIIANNTNTKVKIDMWLNPLGHINVQYPGNIININLADIGVQKTSTVKIK